MSTGLTSLLVMRNLGFKLFDTTEQCKSDAESARKAFDEKKLVLQNILYENGYYQKEINEARNYKSAVSDSEMELTTTDSFFQTTMPTTAAPARPARAHIAVIQRERRRLRPVFSAA